MSQSQKVSERDLVDDIHKCIGYKLDKEVFVRPSYELVRPIYAKFLDDLIPQWRVGDSDSTEPLQMFKWMRQILSGFDIGPELSMNDMFMPNKKRTYDIIHALVHFKHNCEIFKEKKEIRDSENSQKREVLDKFKQDIEAKKVHRDKLAMVIGNAPPIPILKAQAEEKKLQVERGKQHADELDQQAKELKASVLAQENSYQQLSNQLKRVDKEIEECNHATAQAQEKANLRSQIRKIESENEALKHQSVAKRAQEKAKILELHNAVLDSMAPKESRLEELIKKRKDISAVKSELDSKRAELDKQVKLHIDRANKQLDCIRHRYETSKHTLERDLVTMANCQAKINGLIYGEEATTNNATYIKSPRN